MCLHFCICICMCVYVPGVYPVHEVQPESERHQGSQNCVQEGTRGLQDSISCMHAHMLDMYNDTLWVGIYENLNFNV